MTDPLSLSPPRPSPPGTLHRHACDVEGRTRGPALGGDERDGLAPPPTPTLTTDLYGTIRTIDPDAAALLGRPLPWLVARPLTIFFELDDRPGLRNLLSALERGDPAPAVDARTAPRPAGTRRRHLVVSALPSPPSRVAWVLLDQGHPVPEAMAARPTLPQLVTRLAEATTASVSPRQVLEVAADLGASVVGSGVEVSITLGPPDHPEAVTTTGPGVQHLDGTQVRHGVGPGVQAWSSGRTTTSGDVWTDPRWPGLTRGPARPRRVAGAAVVATPVTLAGVVHGTVTALAPAPGIPDGLIETVEALGAALEASLRERGLRAELDTNAGHLEQALASRAVIDQAKGIVIAERSCTPEQAFAHLVEISREREMKVREVARQLVELRSTTRRDPRRGSAAP